MLNFQNVKLKKLSILRYVVKKEFLVDEKQGLLKNLLTRDTKIFDLK